MKQMKQVVKQVGGVVAPPLTCGEADEADEADVFELSRIQAHVCVRARTPEAVMENTCFTASSASPASLPRTVAESGGRRR